MSENLPDPAAGGAEGPLAHLQHQPIAPLVGPEQQQEALQTLIQGGMEANQARAMLGLPPVFQGPEDDPRPNVHYYSPEEDDGDADPESGWTDKQRDRLKAAIQRTISSSEDPVDAIARMFEKGVALGTQKDPFAGSAAGDATAVSTDPLSCDLCGAVVADLDKHMGFAHPGETVTPTDEDVTLNEMGIPMPEGASDEQPELPTTPGSANPTDPGSG